MGLLILTPRICHIPEKSGFRHTQTKNASRRTPCTDCGALQAVGVRVMWPLLFRKETVIQVEKDRQLRWIYFCTYKCVFRERALQNIRCVSQPFRMEDEPQRLTNNAPKVWP